MGLTTEERRKIGNVLTKARGVVERVSPLVNGKFVIRDFRRMLYTDSGSINPEINCHLTNEDRKILGEVREIEPLVMNGFVGLMRKVAEKSIFLGTDMGVEDLVQEGLYIIMLGMMGYDGTTDLMTFFYNLAQRHFLDICKYERRQPKCCHIESDLCHSEAKDEDENPYDQELFNYAMKCVRLTPLEHKVLELIAEGRKDALAEAGRQIYNPRTKQPYTRASAQNALYSAQAKVKGVYANLVARQEARRQEVA